MHEIVWILFYQECHAEIAKSHTHVTVIVWIPFTVNLLEELSCFLEQTIGLIHRILALELVVLICHECKGIQLLEIGLQE